MFGSSQSSGIEMMLRSMGLGEMLDAAKSMMTPDTIRVVVNTVKEVEKINVKLDAIAVNQLSIMRHLGIEQQFVASGEPFEDGQRDGNGGHEPVTHAEPLRIAGT